MSNGQRDWKQFALLLIDAQRDFWTKELAKSFPDFPTNISRLLDLCRAENIEVIHIRVSYKPDMSDWMANYKVLGRIPCVQGTPGIETLPFALEKPGETIIIKQTFDGFHNPQLLRRLRQNGKRFVLAAGLITSTCVLFTAASAVQRGFLSAVIDDCCADEPSAHKYTLDEYRFIFDCVSVDAIPSRYSEWSADLNKLDELEAKFQQSNAGDQ